MAQENKQQLQAMGERLAKASQDNKAAEIQHKLNKVSERWQHLLDLIAARWGRNTLTQKAFSAFFFFLQIGSENSKRNLLKKI